MNKKSFSRIFTIAGCAVLAVAAAMMTTGCTTDNPEVTITYTFQGRDYAVDYRLSRKTAPKTVQHFIELADAEYYNGMCIHHYDSANLYSGGFYYDKDAEDKLEEADYLTKVKELESQGKTFSQSVFHEEGGERIPLYTVYGEFADNGVVVDGTSYTKTQGALIMTYTSKGSDTTRVTTLRNDNGKQNGGDAYQANSLYKYNSATSLFYTFTGSGTGYADQTSECVFGMAKNFSEQLEGTNGLLTAIQAYADGLTTDFTETVTWDINTYDYFESIRRGGLTAEYQVPVEPIIIKSVKVTKY